MPLFQGKKRIEFMFIPRFPVRSFPRFSRSDRRRGGDGTFCKESITKKRLNDFLGGTLMGTAICSCSPKLTGVSDRENLYDGAYNWDLARLELASTAHGMGKHH